jgi:hypothetical protein
VGQSGERATIPVNLQAGHPYAITISYTKTTNVAPGPVVLSWSSFVNQPKEVIPASLLYPTPPASTDTTGSVTQTVLYYCVKGNTVRPENVIRGTFSPINNSKLVVSAWVRLDVPDCNATPAQDSAIQVQFNTGSTWLKKTGLRIEGWQRYEATITVPSNATFMTLRLRTLPATGIFVDDIRVQPFNSNMKGFVYNPVNMRVMAQLDENNYAAFYEYNDDGGLVRVKKETERGIMTIQETRSALFKD